MTERTSRVGEKAKADTAAEAAERQESVTSVRKGEEVYTVRAGYRDDLTGSGQVKDLTTPAESADRASIEAVDIFLLIVHLARELRCYASQIPDDVRDMVKGAGLAPRHIHALIQVGAAGQLSVSQLADRLGVALTTASLLASQLAAVGLVERKEDPDDHRRTLIKVPERFGGYTSVMFNAMLAPIDRTIASTDAAERLAAKSFLTRLAESFSEHDSET
ncbi:MAG: MarR family winged helix-turn-helix transcriptional regulator [Actinobacteria bacterium]|nr:MarR family winged helix-turn-helix transcriptional regulator [Actinomycetota bacterium]